MAATSASLSVGLAAETMASTRSSFSSPVASTDLAGLHRAAGDEDHRDVQPQRGHQHAGVILSQLEMQTSASAQWALTMYSTLSAMISRDGSE
jgi:hypothetical protein